MDNYKYGQLKGRHQILLITAVILVAFNLRASITSLSPIIGLLRESLSISNGYIGILTSLPLIAFAVMSPIVPKLSARFTNEVTLIAGMCILAIGIVIRSVSFIPLVFIGTILIGTGIAVSNVLLPAIIKERFPNRVPLMTSVYTTAMSLFAAIASGVSIPLAVDAGLGWEFTLGIWVFPVIACIVLWVYLVKKSRSADEVRLHYVKADDIRMWRSPLAWQVAIFLGLQAFLYNALMTWLPEILIDYGIDSGSAGWMLSFNQFIGLPASLLIPIVAGKFKSQRSIVLILCTLALAGYTGLLIGESYNAMVWSVGLIGVAYGGLFPLSLAFLAMRSNTPMQAAKLSGMAQAIGYALAATGPILLGSIVDATGTWTYSLYILLFVTVLTAIVGMGAGRDRIVWNDVIKHK